MNEELIHRLLDRYLTGKDGFTANVYEGPPSPERSGQMKAWIGSLDMVMPTIRTAWLFSGLN